MKQREFYKETKRIEFYKNRYYKIFYFFLRFFDF
jgi:hypothetical protein